MQSTVQQNAVTPERARFQGFMAKIEDQGAIHECWVINLFQRIRFKDGTSGPAYKLKIRRVIGYQGWSGGQRPVYGYCAPILVKAERLITTNTPARGNAAAKASAGA